MEFPHHKYSRPSPPFNPQRRWPDITLTSAPRFVSVDLRDGNQALVRPMSSARKLEMFQLLCALGFKEIEIGFPAASSTDLEFVRMLADRHLVPDDVTVQVLTQCRRDLIEGTFAAIDGLGHVIVHLYNSTNPLQRDVVFSATEDAVVDLAVSAASLCASLAAESPCHVTFEYSPESFSDTETAFAVRIATAVADVLMPVSYQPMIVNLPATVEMSGPHIYADQVELFAAAFPYRDRVVLSVHPHNDRGCAVAAAELACMAGAERVEGTLFGNGERTGNVDLVTLALNLATHGIDPTLRLGEIDALVAKVVELNELPVHPRHPYAGELVYTAFSGSHQDAIKKGMARLGFAPGRHPDYDTWAVPYLPLDPAHLGRSYEPVIRVNSQSGKGGVSWLLLNEYNLDLPRPLAAEFAALVQRECDSTGEEMTSLRARQLLASEYQSPSRLTLTDFTLTTTSGKTELSALLRCDGTPFEISAVAAGPLEAFMAGLSAWFGSNIDICDYREHAVERSAAADAACYIQMECDARSSPVWALAMSESTTHASLLAATNAVDRLLASGALSPPPTP